MGRERGVNAVSRPGNTMAGRLQAVRRSIIFLLARQRIFRGELSLTTKTAIVAPCATMAVKFVMSFTIRSRIWAQDVQ